MDGDKKRSAPLESITTQRQAIHLTELVCRMFLDRQSSPPGIRVRATTISEACLHFDIRLVVDAMTGAVELLATFVGRTRRPQLSASGVMDRMKIDVDDADGRGFVERARNLVSMHSSMSTGRFTEYCDDFALTYTTAGIEELIRIGSSLVSALVDGRAASDAQDAVARLKAVMDAEIRETYSA